MKTYDPKQVVLIVGGRQITGFAADTFITVARNSDAFTMQVGVDGEGTRSKSNDKSGTFTFSLMQTAKDNEYLSSLALADELDNSGVVPVMVKDVNGSSLELAEQAYIQKMPDSEFNREATGREWILATDALQKFVGGN